MGRKLPPDQLALYKRVDEVLHYIWDPIGVSTMSPIPRDEYHAYLPLVFRLLIEEQTEAQIAAYLLSVEREQMGMDGADYAATRTAICKQVAHLLVEDWIALRHYHNE